MIIYRSQPGYVALVTVAVVMSAVIVVGVTITLLVTTGLLASFTTDQGTRALYLADTCANEAMLRAKREGVTYAGTHTLTIGDNTCTIDATATTATELSIEATGNYNNAAYRTVYLVMETDPFSLTSWQETE